MKILVVGGGGREHAIIRKLKQSPQCGEIWCAPGNGGIACDAKCKNIKATDLDGMVAFAKEEGFDYAVVAQDDPLALGMVDRLAEIGIPSFGPNAAAARIEASKVFSKDLMKKYHIPTADYAVFNDPAKAMQYIEQRGKYPVVVKADGLALGKGVLICQTEQEAREGLKEIMLDKKFGSAGNQMVIEEFLTGPEFSFMCFVDGLKVYPLALSQDHKRAFDGDKGPNTGGMGAYSPLPFISREDEDYAMEHIMKKVAAGMVSEGCPFKGVLYGGLMKTPDGIKVIEFNCRFGDPETEVVLPRLETDIYLMFSAVADSDSSMPPVKWADNVVLGFVMASKGYPGSYEKGFEISGLEDAMSDPAVRIYQMGTKLAEVEGRESPVLVTSGGRVLMVVAAAPTALEARDKALAAVGKIRCANLFNRTDIGHWIF